MTYPFIPPMIMITMDKLKCFETMCDTSNEEDNIIIETNEAREKLDTLLVTKNLGSFWKANENYVIHGKVEDWKTNSVSFIYSENDFIPVDLKKYYEVKTKRDINIIDTVLGLFKLHLKNENKTHYEESDCFSSEYECIEFERETNEYINKVCS